MGAMDAARLRQRDFIPIRAYPPCCSHRVFVLSPGNLGLSTLKWGAPGTRACDFKRKVLSYDESSILWSSKHL